mgnify:CR=1 FL=1
MSPIEKRFLYFLLGCIPTRIGLGYLITNLESHKPTLLVYFISTILLIIGMGFILIFTFGLRKTGAETQGQPIWWNSLRPIHGSLYLLAGLILMFSFKTTILKTNITSSKLIFFDTLLGLIAFILYHLHLWKFKTPSCVTKGLGLNPVKSIVRNFTLR